MNTLHIKKLIAQNKTLNKSKTPAELLVRALALLYTKAEKVSDAFFLAHGITDAQYNVLALLAEEDDGINQLNISLRMLVSQGNITRILDKLVKAGLIKRVEDKNDRRHKRIFITPKGRKLHEQIKPEYDKFIRALPKKLSESVQKNTAYALIEWAHLLDEKDL